MNQDIENYVKQKKIIKMNLYTALLDIFIAITSIIRHNGKFTFTFFTFVLLASICFYICFIFEKMNTRTSKELFKKLVDQNYIKIIEKRTVLYTLEEVLKTSKLNLETRDEATMLESAFNKVIDNTTILKKFPNLTEIVKVEQSYEYLKPYHKVINEVVVRNTKNQIVVISNRKDVITEDILI